MRNAAYLLKKAKSFLFTVLMLLICKCMTAQFISYPVPAQPITRGLDSTLLTVQISFPVCTGVTVTINLGASNSPGVIEYIPGSVTLISGTGTITENNITNLRSPVFSIGNTTFGQTLRFSIKRRGFCSSAAPDVAVSNFRVVKGASISTMDWNISWPIEQLKFELFRI